MLTFTAKFDCHDVVQWWSAHRGPTNLTVGVCPTHGVAYARRGQIVVPFFFIFPRSTADIQIMLHNPALCILCLQADNLRCTYMLCQNCCATLRNPCRLLAHTALGASTMPQLPLQPLQELDVGEVDIRKRIKITVYCLHFWPRSPVRESGTVQYNVQLLTRRSKRLRFPYEALTAPMLAMLRLDGVPIERIRYAHDLLAGPAFDSHQRARYTLHGDSIELRLFVYATVGELGRHIEQLKPEELALDRDWNTLGTVNAHVNCHFMASGMTTGWKILELPRRRLILEDCKFYLQDFSADARAALGIAGIDNGRINDGASVPLDVQPYDAGGSVTDVEIWLYVRP